jgi:hypothetical protein
LTAVFDRGELRNVRLGTREVLRAIHGSVRGAGWKTVLPRIEELDVTSAADRFHVGFRSIHEDGPVRFAWSGRIAGDASGTIRFELDGAALSTFSRNRIGICVLYPLAGCAGHPCTLEHTDGTRREETFPYHVNPHQPFFDLRAIRHDAGAGFLAEVRFEGETFEAEDHRNWSDASFKVYPIPLARPYPVEVPAGTRVKQVVTLRLLPNEASAEAAAETAAASGPPPPVHGAPPPLVGVGLGPRPLSAREVDRVRALRLDHLRADLDLRLPDWPKDLARASDAARAAETPLRLAVVCPDDPDWVLGRLGEEVERRKAAATSVALFGEAQVTTPGLVALGRERLAGAMPAARFGAGSNVYFTDLNRNRSAADGGDFVVFPQCPQVHAYDDATVRDNLGSLRWIAATARSFVGGRPLSVSPVTLRVRGQDPDPRQRTAFGVEWTARFLASAQEAGIESLTLYEVTGPAGLMDGEELFPVYGVLADRPRST